MVRFSLGKARKSFRSFYACFRCEADKARYLGDGMMRVLLKRIAALVLAISFFLPLTQCSQKLGDHSPPYVVSASNADNWPGLFSTIYLLLFFWPLAIQVWRWMKRLRLPSRRASWIEAGLSLLSLAGVSWLIFPMVSSFGASIRYGAYLAYGSAFTYGVASLVEAVRRSPQPMTGTS